MTVTPKPNPQVFVVLNPAAGVVNVQGLKQIIERKFHEAGWSCHFHLSKKDEDISAFLTDKVLKEIDLVVAAGGDGTIAAVAAGMVHSTIPLGIIPTGTWNAIARHLLIPLNPQKALDIIIGKHKVRRLDLMSVGENLHAMNLGVGFSATMAKETGRAEKRKFGRLAYYATLIKQVFGMELKRFEIEADGKIYKGRATEIMVANYGVVGLNMLESGLNIHPDDGKVDVLIMVTRTILDLPILFWQAFVQRKKRTPKYRQLSASRVITITTKPSLHVQADGDLIGMTPVKITVIPRCVRVIAPK